MRPSAAAKLDARCRAELEAERDRHARAIQSLAAADSGGLAAECELYLRNVDHIMHAFAAG